VCPAPRRPWLRAAVEVEGVFAIAVRAAADEIAVGATLYWSAGSAEFTTTASGSLKAGYATAAAAAGVTAGEIRLTPGAAWKGRQGRPSWIVGAALLDGRGFFHGPCPGGFAPGPAWAGAGAVPAHPPRRLLAEAEDPHSHGAMNSPCQIRPPPSNVGGGDRTCHRSSMTVCLA
jgi:hypothetical protein